MLTIAKRLFLSSEWLNADFKSKSKTNWSDKWMIKLQHFLNRCYRFPAYKDLWDTINGFCVEFYSYILQLARFQWNPMKFRREEEKRDVLETQKVHDLLLISGLFRKLIEMFTWKLTLTLAESWTAVTAVWHFSSQWLPNNSFNSKTIHYGDWLTSYVRNW